MATRRAKRLLIIGWDAADWIMIDRLFAQGKMPNLKGLVDSGVRADLATLEPKLSPILWTSIATGKWGDKHGILNFVEPNPAGDGLRISASTTRRTKAVWNMLTQSGLKANTVGWYASHPAEAISGVAVSNLVQDGVAEGTVHPEASRERITPCRARPEDFSRGDLAVFVPDLAQTKSTDEHPRKLATQLARMRTIHRAALEVLRSDPAWDGTMIFYETIDTVGHHFMECFPPRMKHIPQEDVRLYGEVMPRIYEVHDTALGELLAAAGPDTTVMLLSDHGFHSGADRPVIGDIDPKDRAALEASWHRPFGILVLSGPGIKKGAVVQGPSLLDIAPTALALLGLPTGADMDGRVLAEAFDAAYEPTIIESWDTLGGADGMHSADRRADPFESADALKQLIDLGYMPALAGGTEAQIALARRESEANLSVIYMSSGRPALAMPLLEKLHAGHPDESRFVVNLANCLMAAREFDRCEAVLAPFVARHRAVIEPRLQLVAALAQKGERDAARVELDAAAPLAKGRADLALALADLRTLLHQWPEAATLYAAAARHDPADPRPQVGLARVALHERRFEAAADHCLDAAERRHLTPEAHDFLGIALAWMGDHAHAIQSFEYAVAMRPGLVDAHRFLALLADRTGDSEKAQRHRARVQQLLATATAPPPPPDPFGPEAWAAHAAGLPS